MLDAAGLRRRDRILHGYPASYSAPPRFHRRRLILPRPCHHGLTGTGPDPACWYCAVTHGLKRGGNASDDV